MRVLPSSHVEVWVSWVNAARDACRRYKFMHANATHEFMMRKAVHLSSDQMPRWQHYLTESNVDIGRLRFEFLKDMVVDRAQVEQLELHGKEFEDELVHIGCAENAALLELQQEWVGAMDNAIAHAKHTLIVRSAGKVLVECAIADRGKRGTLVKAVRARERAIWAGCHHFWRARCSCMRKGHL